MSKYLENEKLLPLLTLGDIVANATGTAYINLKNCVGVAEIDLFFGTVTSTDAASAVVVTVEGSTAGAATDTNTQIAFKYRLSSAVATDSLGDLTAATASGGASVTAADDNKILAVFVDPSVVQAAADDDVWIRAYLTPAAEISATNVCAWGRFVPRKAGASIPSST